MAKAVKITPQEAALKLRESSEQLSQYGGFDIVATTVAKGQNLDPNKKALKNIFLNEDTYAEDREELEVNITQWLELIKAHENVADMISAAGEQQATSERLLSTNQSKGLEATRTLEQAYRTMAMFYKNAGTTKVKDLTIVNADPDQITDLDNTTFFDYINDLLVDNFDRLDLSRNYSLLVLPGYLGKNAVLEKWAKAAHKNKVMMITDFRDLESPDDVMALFESAKHAGSDTYRANVIMTCNWLLGREKEGDVGEEEDIYLPPSAALAGLLYATRISQPPAAYKHGGLSEVSGVHFDLRHSEISDLEKLGLVPIVNEFGKVMSYSAKTLFNGDDLGLKTYSVVRVFNWISKCLCDYLNRMAFQNFTVKTKKAIESQLISFLEGIKGADRIIEKFKIIKFEQDPKQKDRILLDIHVKPFFPAKNFVIKLSGTKGEDPEDPNFQAEVTEA